MIIKNNSTNKNNKNSHTLQLPHYTQRTPLLVKIYYIEGNC